MSFVWNIPGANSAGNIVLNCLIITALYGLIMGAFAVVIKRKFSFIFLGCSYVIAMLCYLFNLIPALIVLVGATTAVIIAVASANLGELRNYLSNPFKRNSGKTNKKHIEKIFDRHAVYRIIDSTVKQLSSTKTGAIMTFEKGASLEDFCKNGVKIDSPVTQELLTTIFYPGTRLHDGAVIIRGDKIVSASVFFTPSTRAFTAKFGSRHRAAIGISEVSDAVTVVVSEETGRISIAVNGQIESVSDTHFLRVFENYMMDSNGDK